MRCRGGDWLGLVVCWSRLMLQNRTSLIKKKNLITDIPITPFAFCCLPNIHKHPTKQPGGPIVARNNLVFQSIAIFSVQILCPKVLGMCPFLLYSSIFFNHLGHIETLPEGFFICCMDLCNLYTSISLDDGLRVIPPNIIFPIFF